ncbi:MAG: D-sedoheptulose 7-phosphate isomerase [Bdellovibrionaceae bacterium]|nr:D-sedoheptulose 7-phosphate isomerase [Pseudobdellovibrionaceae bacterium]
MTPLEVWKTSLSDAQTVLNEFVNQPTTWDLLTKFSNLLISSYKKGGKILICGNGGSHCDALHFAEELTGRYRKDRKPLGALALGEASHVTCVSNDYGFQYIFSRQVEALGRTGDALIGLSTSGNSPNVIEAFKVAKSMGFPTVALLGKGGGELAKIADLAIVVPGVTSDRIQELHMLMLHTVIETVEREIFPENYK